MGLRFWCCFAHSVAVSEPGTGQRGIPASQCSAPQSELTGPDAAIMSANGRREISRSSRRSSMAVISALPSSVQALHEACAERGGFEYLKTMPSCGHIVTVDDFRGFCENNLGLDSTVALSVLSLLDTSNNIVRIPKLVSVLKVIQPLTLLTPGSEGSPVASSMYDMVDDSRDASILEELAGILDVEAVDLHADLARRGSAAVLQQLTDLLQRVAQSRCMHSIPDVKLPQGTNAPYVAARQGTALLGFQVPVWSLRAVHQSKPDPPARSGLHHRPQNRPAGRLLEQGDTIATALLRQHLVASGVITVPDGLDRMPKAVRGQALALRTAGTAALGTTKVSGQTGVVDDTSARTWLDQEIDEESNSAVLHKCLTKANLAGSATAAGASPPAGGESTGAIVARASRQGLPGGFSVSSIIGMPVPSGISLPLEAALSRGSQHSSDGDSECQEERLRGHLGTTHRLSSPAASMAHISWADQDGMREGLWATRSQGFGQLDSDNRPWPPGSLPGLPPANLVMDGTAPAGSNGVVSKRSDPSPTRARQITFSMSTIAQAERRPMPDAYSRDGTTGSVFGLAHAATSMQRDWDPAAEEQVGSGVARMALGEGELPGLPPLVQDTDQQATARGTPASQMCVSHACL
eukprot:jgi/Ulvmu1/1902/UM012_0061.1